MMKVLLILIQACHTSVLTYIVSVFSTRFVVDATYMYIAHCTLYEHFSNP